MVNGPERELVRIPVELVLLSNIEFKTVDYNSIRE